MSIHRNYSNLISFLNRWACGLSINRQCLDQLYRWILDKHRDLNDNKWITLYSQTWAFTW